MGTRRYCNNIPHSWLTGDDDFPTDHRNSSFLTTDLVFADCCELTDSMSLMQLGSSRNVPLHTIPADHVSEEEDIVEASPAQGTGSFPKRKKRRRRRRKKKTLQPILDVTKGINEASSILTHKRNVLVSKTQNDDVLSSPAVDEHLQDAGDISDTEQISEGSLSDNTPSLGGVIQAEVPEDVGSSGTFQEEATGQSEYNELEEEVNRLMGTPLVLMALEAGLEVDQVRLALEQRIEEKGEAYASADDLVMDVLQMVSSEESDDDEWSDMEEEERGNRSVVGQQQSRQSPLANSEMGGLEYTAAGYGYRRSTAVSMGTSTDSTSDWEAMEVPPVRVSSVGWGAGWRPMDVPPVHVSSPVTSAGNVSRSVQREVPDIVNISPTVRDEAHPSWHDHIPQQHSNKQGQRMQPDFVQTRGTSAVESTSRGRDSGATVSNSRGINIAPSNMSISGVKTGHVQGTGDLSARAMPSAPRHNTSSSADSRLCKVCFEEEVSTVFLPCRHGICCTKCSKALHQCPLCRKEIRDTFQVFFS